MLTNNSAASQVETKSASDDSLTIVSSASVSIESISPDSGATSANEGYSWNPSTQKNVSSPLTTISKSTTTPSKPTVEGDSKNGQQPKNPALTDKTKKPTYKIKPKASSKTSGGSTDDNHAGQVYVDGFGWVTLGPKGHGTAVSGDWGAGHR